MKATYRSGRTGSATHNDRSFKTQEERTPGDIAVKTVHRAVYRATRSLEAAELAYYEEKYKDGLQAQNEAHIKGGHKNRCKTIEDLYKGQRTKPLETLLQVGNMTNSIAPDTLMVCVDAYAKEVEARYPHYHILSMAVHMDESTPHVHIRAVFDYPDSDGRLRIGQEKGLQAMGIPLPDPHAPANRYNCRLMTWTERQRGLFIDICRGYGLYIDDPCRTDRKHLSTREYKAREMHRERTEIPHYAQERHRAIEIEHDLSR